MWDGVEFVEFEFVVRADIDVGTFVLSAVTIPWCREDFQGLVLRRETVWGKNTCNASPVMFFLVPFHPHFMAANDGL